MPYLHVYVRYRDRFGNDREGYFLNLSEEQLEEKIVKPYHNAQPLILKGQPVDPLKISEITISATREHSVKLLPSLIAEERSRAKESAYGWILDDNCLVVNCGTKVTEKYIKHPPAKKTTA